MAISLKFLFSPIKKTLVSLTSYCLARPRIDVDIVPNSNDIKGQRATNMSSMQDEEIPAIPYVKWDFDFYWNFKIIIKNNSSKTAYNLKIEKLYSGPRDYLEKFSEVASLKESDSIELDYILRSQGSFNINEANLYSQSFPPFVDKIELILSYTNEARFHFYTLFVFTAEGKENEHLIFKPRILS